MHNDPITENCAAEAPKPFVHTPRPGAANHMSAGFSRAYGHDEHAARLGITAAHFDGAVYVQSRLDEQPGIAALRIDVSGDVSFVSANVFLDAAGLRELARCLIDAAADIEADAAQQGGAA